MKVELLDLNGETKTYTGVSRYAFTNHETFGSPKETVQVADSERLLIVNTNNYAALLVEGE